MEEDWELPAVDPASQAGRKLSRLRKGRPAATRLPPKLDENDDVNVDHAQEQCSLEEKESFLKIQADEGTSEVGARESNFRSGGLHTILGM